MNPSKYRSKNLIQKLYNREVFGQFIRGVSVNHEPSKQLFPTVPDGLVFDLKETLPHIGNHIFMGATRCGQFLLTYTFMIDPTIFSPPLHYRYRLHFWAFRPGRFAAKVAEVQLFDLGDVLEVLTLGVVQWPNLNDRLLVFGYGNGPGNLDAWSMDYADGTTDAYVTVTTMPSLSGCADCRAVAASFDEEEMAANWETGVGLTCVRHGLTIHTSFAVPYPYRFDPQLCACVDGKVVLNTGSFVHVLEFDTEEGAAAPPPHAAPHAPHRTPSHPPQRRPETDSKLIVNVPLDNRLSYTFLRERSYTEFLSDTWAGNIMQMLIEQRLQQGHVVVDELPVVLKIAIQKYLDYSMNCHSLRQAKLAKLNNEEWTTVVGSHNATRGVVEVGERFQTTRHQRLFNPGSKPKLGKRSMDDADKVYDFKESDEGKCEPKFKLYRRRCLADKMYEFRSDEDADMENVRPREKLVRKSPAGALLDACKPPSPSPPRPPALLLAPHRPQHYTHRYKTLRESGTQETVLWWDYHSDSETEEESEGGRMSREVRAILAEWEVDEEENSRSSRRPPRHPRPRNRVYLTRQPARSRRKHSSFELTDAMKKEMKRGFGHQPVDSCSVRFTRRFIEIDQEITSTITHIEDDEIGPGFQCALPLSVHGSAYSQMEMISDHKAEKLNVWCAVVTQNTLDIEHFCQKAADRICRMEGFKFWFCSDYDTEIISVCPVTDDILFVIFIKLNAERTSVVSPLDSRRKCKADLRNFYETRCLFIWSPREGRCYLEGYSGLSRSREECELDEGQASGNLASSEASFLRTDVHRYFGLEQRSVRAFVHHSKDGSLAPPLTLILDHENLIGFRRF